MESRQAEEALGSREWEENLGFQTRNGQNPFQHSGRYMPRLPKFRPGSPRALRLLELSSLPLT